MINDRKELLATVFCEVLERFSFLFGELISKEEIPETGSRYLQATMAFRGVISGKLVLAVPEAMCPVIAGNVLGMEPVEALKIIQSDDALKELLNITCGQVLTALVGDEPVFD
ncbi:MAG: chemotaxis protein CheX, partial [Deltaproteobacteria bacterium]|nr:chemotaxis protein CheX [Deltaproteobacteria bacterium]